MAAQSIKLSLVGKVDASGKEYFFTVPKLPILVDLSQCVLFVHPYENDEGDFGADLMIKTYDGKRKDNDED